MDKDDPPYGFDDVWATSWDQELFGFRGTLMVAINAATIMGATEVVLCGVDLEDNHHFYSETVDHSGFDSWIQEGTPEWDPETGVHSTCVPARGCRGVLDGLRWVSKNINIKCAYKGSLLVDRGILEYKSITQSEEDEHQGFGVITRRWDHVFKDGGV